MLKLNWFKRQYSLIKIPWRVHKGYTRLYILLRILLGLLPSFYVIAYASFINNILNFYSGTIGYEELFPVFLWIVVLSLFKYFSGNLIAYISTKLRIELLSVLKIESIQKRSRLKYELVENKDSWDLIHRTVKGIPDQITKGFFNLFDLVELVIKILSITVIIGTFSLISAGIILVCFVPIVLVSIRSGEEDYDSFVKFQKVQRRLDNYENVLVSKDYADERTIFNYSSWFTKRWKDTYKQATEIFLSVKKKNYTKVKTTSLIITVIFLGIIVVLMKLTIEQTISLGLFTATVMQLLELSSKISWSLSSIIYQLASSSSYMNDYIAFYELEENENVSASVKLENVEHIEFQNVSFKYPGNEDYTLRNVNMKLNSDENYAIVGENGAGKSSLIKLILKLYDGYEGIILVNGVDLRKIKDVSSLFSVMFQDYAKYEISILNNILFGNSESMDVSNVLSRFEHLNFPIHSKGFSSGLDTELGRLTDKNTDISIGQWQKLAMIRASAQEGQYYILDEPTAALDPMAEAAIYTDFMKILSDNPSIIITHRLGAARLADKIIVMSQGTIAQMGTHDELLDNGGLYKEMYENQRMWYIDEETEVC
jgi:ATP-binding cassette subfamily B protein